MTENQHQYEPTRRDLSRISVGFTALLVDVPLLVSQTVNPHSLSGKALFGLTAVAVMQAVPPLERIAGLEETFPTRNNINQKPKEA